MHEIEDNRKHKPALTGGSSNSCCRKSGERPVDIALYSLSLSGKVLELASKAVAYSSSTAVVHWPVFVLVDPPPAITTILAQLESFSSLLLYFSAKRTLQNVGHRLLYDLISFVMR